MNSLDLREGTFRLKADVANPKPDRRHRHDWQKAKAWKAGTIFHVTAWSPTHLHHTIWCLRPASKIGDMTPNHPAWDSLLENLEATPETVSNWLKRQTHNPGAYALEVLDRLEAAGLVTLQQVREVVQAYDASM